MVLRSGITGFRYYKDAPIPECDVKLFKTCLFGALQGLEGKLVSLNGPNVGRNYSIAQVDVDFEFTVLLNQHFPVIGFAASSSGRDFRFIDFEKLTDALNQFGIYEIVPADRLRSDVTSDDLANLLPVELKQVKYWTRGNRQLSVGEIIFNNWD